MDVIKIPYTSYLVVKIKDFSEFIQNELLNDEIPKDYWIYDIGDNIYCYLEEFFKEKGIKYDEDLDEELLDSLCDSIFRYLKLL